MKALFLEPFFDQPKIPDLEFLNWDGKNTINTDEIEIIFAKLSRKLGRDFLLSFINLKFIVCPTTGIDHIDLDYCDSKGIRVVYLSSKDIPNIYSTTEIALWHIINLTRRVTPYIQQTRELRWDRYAFESVSLRSHKVGIVGFGRLGRQIYKALKCLGANITVFDSDPEKMGGLIQAERAKSIEEIFSKSSIVSLHMTSNRENTSIIDRRVLSNITFNPFFLINTSRGNLIEEGDLLEYINKGTVTGYGADTIIDEYELKTRGLSKSRRAQASLLVNPSVFLTPHIGGATSDSIRATEQIVYSKLTEELAIHQTKGPKAD